MAKASSTAKKHLRSDKVFAPLVNDIRLESLNLTDDVYFRLIRAILFQQLSGKAASTIFERFLALFPKQYPDPQLLIDFSLEELRAAGVSRQKAGYIQNVARHFLERDLLRQDWSRIRDEDILKELTQIKGVGPWTVQMILIFSLGRKDILPLGDISIQKAMTDLYQLEGSGKALQQQMLKVAERWRPYRSVAVRYLWEWRDAIL